MNTLCKNIDCTHVYNFSETKRRRTKPSDVAAHYISIAKDPDGFELRFIDKKIGMYCILHM